MLFSRQIINKKIKWGIVGQVIIAYQFPSIFYINETI